MIRWIVSLAFLFAFAFFLDRVAHPSSEGGFRRNRAESAPSVSGEKAQNHDSAVNLRFHPPVDDHDQLAIDYAPAEAGNDDGGRALHIRTTRAAPVRAGVEGEVLAVSHLTSSGLAVDLLDPAGGRWIRYGHLYRIAPGIRQGEKVGRGQILGWTGSTGLPNETRSFLHLSVRRVPKGGEWWKAAPEDAGTLLASARP